MKYCTMYKIKKMYSVCFHILCYSRSKQVIFCCCQDLNGAHSYVVTSFEKLVYKIVLFFDHRGHYNLLLSRIHNHFPNILNSCCMKLRT